MHTQTVWPIGDVRLFDQWLLSGTWTRHPSGDGALLITQTFRSQDVHPSKQALLDAQLNGIFDVVCNIDVNWGTALWGIFHLEKFELCIGS